MRKWQGLCRSTLCIAVGETDVKGEQVGRVKHGCEGSWCRCNLLEKEIENIIKEVHIVEYPHTNQTTMHQDHCGKDGAVHIVIYPTRHPQGKHFISRSRLQREGGERR